MDCGGDIPELAYFTKRLGDDDGNPIGTTHEKPILDTCVYELEYNNGYTVPVSANIIAENLFHQVFNKGHRIMVLDEVIRHQAFRTQIGEKDAYKRR